MLGIIDAVVSLGSLIVPPVFDFVKKKFCPQADTPTATLGTLACTKPEVIPAFIEGQAKLLGAQVAYYNRDVIGEVSRWVRDLRASIRPIVVVAGLLYITGAGYFNWHVDPAMRHIMEVAICSWFGCRLQK